MGCRQSKDVGPTLTELVNDQPNKVKHKLALAIKRDDPVLFQIVMQNNNISLQEALNDGFDTNWTFIHYAAAKNAAKVIESFLESRLSSGQLSFDIVNAKDISGKSPLEIAHNYSCLEAFRSLLKTCSKYQYKVNIKNELIKSLENDSEYFKLINLYKSQRLGVEDDNLESNSMNEDDNYCSITNRGLATKAFTQKEKELAENKFKDKDFWNLVTNNENSKLKSEEDKSSKLTWIGVKDLLTQGFKIYNKGSFNSKSPISSINPNLNPLFCALNEFPYYLSLIFYSMQSNEKGLWAVILYHNGLPELVFLDEYFPCNKQKDNFIFQKPYDIEIWPMMIEKGLAKAYGGFSKIANLDSLELLETIFGASAKKFKVSDSSIDLFWMTLQDLDHTNQLTFFSLKEKKALSFFMGGIFSVEEKRIIKLKACDPKAKCDRSLADALLDDESRKILGYETKDEGWYFIELEQFVEQFEDVVISQFNGSWNRRAIKMKNFGTKIENFEFEIKNDTKLILSLFQDIDGETAYYPLHFVLLQKDGSSIKTIAEGDSNCKSGSKICYIDDEKEVNLQPGKYIIQIKAITKSKKKSLLGTLVAYSQHLISFSPLTNKKLLEEVFVSLGKSNNLKEQCGAGCEFTSGWWSIYYWLYFENNSQKTWEIEVKFENLSNLKLGKTFRSGNDTFKVIVEKGQKKVAYLQKKNPAKDSDFKLDMNHLFT